jgi:drug/metabolite transporter (DMT)-like permease
MVSDSITGDASPIGAALAVLVAVAFCGSTVLTRRFAHVRMTPACCLGMALTMVIAAPQASGFAVSGANMALLFAFGAINLGVGMALFATGARLVPATIVALVSTAESVLGPVFVWLVHGETPSMRVVSGGGIVLVGLLGHLTWQYRAQRRLNEAAKSPA